MIAASRLSAIALFAALGVASSAASRSVLAQDGGIALGAKVPAATVRTLDGKTVDLTSVVGAGPAVIEFWATWCPNCKELEPTVAACQKKFSGQVRFVTVAVAINESMERVQRHVAAHATPGTVVYDADGKAATAFDAPATSYVVIVNRNGQVSYTGVGGDQKLEEAIKKAL